GAEAQKAAEGAPEGAHRVGNLKSQADQGVDLEPRMEPTVSEGKGFASGSVGCIDARRIQGRIEEVAEVEARAPHPLGRLLGMEPQIGEVVEDILVSVQLVEDDAGF